MRKDYQFNLDVFDEATGSMTMLEIGMLMRLIHLQNSGVRLPSSHSEIADLLDIDRPLVSDFIVGLYNEEIAEDASRTTMMIKTDRVGITLV